jgi:hypothetical protein
MLGATVGILSGLLKRASEEVAPHAHGREIDRRLLLPRAKAGEKVKNGGDDESGGEKRRGAVFF